MEMDIPQGVQAKLEGSSITVSGKLGSTAKGFNPKLTPIQISNGKITISEPSNKKLSRKAKLAETSLSHELASAFKGVESGVETRMQIIYAHFPISLEVKGDTLYIKNIFGEKNPRLAKIVGSTKVEVKGQDVTLRGVDQTDVGQTIANIKKAVHVTAHDTRVFQDGLYVTMEE
jgi:large subunit ribosomal protein L6